MKSKAGPRDTVILHQIGRGPWAPSVSPFVLKLETYLRMAEIPYENLYGGKRSSKGKTPWIRYNDDNVDDSQFCIEYLNEKRNVDLNKHLTDEQKAVAVGFQRLVEDNLYWVFNVHLFVDNVDYTKELLKHLIPGIKGKIASRLFPGLAKKQLWQQGTGRHSQQEVMHIGEVNLKALADYLGSKSYLMGDEPCEQDGTLFALLAQFLYSCPEDSAYKTLITEKHSNLVAYCERMKTRFWPDWDQCITHGWTKKATK